MTDLCPYNILDDVESRASITVKKRAWLVIRLGCVVGHGPPVILGSRSGSRRDEEGSNITDWS